MAGRAYWKGYLKLSLVSCPVKLYSATSASAGKISFNLLHKDTLNRVQQKYHDPELGEIDLRIVHVGCRGHVRQKRAQFVPTLSARGANSFVREQEPQILLQAAIDGVLQRKRQDSGNGLRRHAAGEGALRRRRGRLTARGSGI